jgi:hypothetical protein
MTVLTDISLTLERAALLAQAHLEPGSADALELLALAGLAERVARPKAAYTIAFIEARTGDTLRVGGATFTSRTLSRNLENAERVFAHVATCGHEMDEAFSAPDDPLKEFWWDLIKSHVIAAAVPTSVWATCWACGMSARTGSRSPLNKQMSPSRSPAHASSSRLPALRSCAVTMRSTRPAAWLRPMTPCRWRAPHGRRKCGTPSVPGRACTSHATSGATSTRTVEVTIWRQHAPPRTIIHLANRSVPWTLATGARKITEILPVHDVEMRLPGRAERLNVSGRGAHVHVVQTTPDLVLRLPVLQAHAAVVIAP